MNRRDFLSASAAACLLPALPAIPDLRPIRVWEFEAGDWWVAARSAEDAIRIYDQDCGGGEADSIQLSCSTTTTCAASVSRATTVNT